MKTYSTIALWIVFIIPITVGLYLVLTDWKLEVAEEVRLDYKDNI